MESVRLGSISLNCISLNPISPNLFLIGGPRTIVVYLGFVQTIYLSTEIGHFVA